MEYNFPVSAIPEFVAGFVYEMVGVNHLTEIQACYQGFDAMAPEIEAGISDIKKGGWDNDVQAALQFGLVALQVPQALSTCENMGDDIAAIESWAKIFTNPTALAAAVSKHYVLHRKEIQGDISSLETDWTAASYYTAGEDLGKLLTDAVGPIESKVSQGYGALQPTTVPDLVAGFVDAMYGVAPFASTQELSSYLEGCFVLDPTAEATVNAAMDLFQQRGQANIQQGVNMILSVTPQLFGGFGACSTEATNISGAFGYVNDCKNMDPDKRFIMEVRNLKNHYGEISGYWNNVSVDFNSGNFFDAGYNFEKAITLVLPPSQVP